MAEGINYEKDLEELDRIWPLGKQLIIPDGGKVLVAGAYEGRYMDYVCSRYKPSKVLGFEPQPEKVIVAEARLQRHAPITKVYGVGIGVHDCIAFMDGEGDGSKISRAGQHAREVKLRSIDSILTDHGPFDLFICNMEGYEVPLLSYLITTGRIKEIKSLAIQFHSEDPRLIQMLDLESGYGVPVYEDFPTWCYFLYDQRTA